MRSLLTIPLLVTSAAAVQVNNLALMMRLCKFNNNSVEKISSPWLLSNFTFLSPHPPYYHHTADLRNQPGAIVLSDVWRTVAMGAILAVKDFNARDARYTPSLADSDYASCDVQFNPTM
jgi:hypothetical protein